MNTVILPWPPRELNPNTGTNWRTKIKFIKDYRLQCRLLTQQAKMVVPDGEGSLHLWLTFCPPNRKRRDDDNLIASFKAGRDGIADALGIDDSRFITHPQIDTQTGGYIRVVITGEMDD